MRNFRPPRHPLPDNQRRAHRSLHLITILMVLLGSVLQQLLTLPFWTPLVIAAEQPAPQAAAPATLPPTITQTDKPPTAQTAAST